MLIKEPKIRIKGVEGFEKSDRAIHFGINPTRGGRPPNERSMRAVIKTITELVLIEAENVFKDTLLKAQK